MSPLAFGWTRIADHYWLHHNTAVIRLRWQRMGSLQSYILGQGDVGANAAKYHTATYCGPLLEFRYNGQAWAYSLDYPARPNVLSDLARDLYLVGTPLDAEVLTQLRRAIPALARWGRKNGYSYVDGRWSEEEKA